MCKKRECYLAYRKDVNKVRLENERKQNPRYCVMCKGLLGKGQRKYHPECKAEKNRKRAKDWYAKNKNRIPKDSKPLRNKKFGTFKCKFCRRESKRSSAQQIACVAPKCQRARKQLSKKLRTEKRRLKDPVICKYCLEPVYQGRDVKYHATCKRCELCDKPLKGDQREFHPECRKERDRILRAIEELKSKPKPLSKNARRGKVEPNILVHALSSIAG